MIYMRPEDNDAGMTVEDETRPDFGAVRVTIPAIGVGVQRHCYRDDDAEALLRGLLRWKLRAPTGTRGTPDLADELFEWLSHVVPEVVGSEEDVAEAMLGRRP